MSILSAYFTDHLPQKKIGQGALFPFSDFFLRGGEVSLQANIERL